MQILNILVGWVLPLSMLTFGITGNLIGLTVFSRKGLTKFPAKNIYRVLAVMDSFYLLVI
jgi:hypothetical protein